MFLDFLNVTERSETEISGGPRLFSSSRCTCDRLPFSLPLFQTEPAAPFCIYQTRTCTCRRTCSNYHLDGSRRRLLLTLSRHPGSFRQNQPSEASRGASPCTGAVAQIESDLP